MHTSIRVFRINTGSCGGCDAHIVSAIQRVTDIELVSTPIDAHVWLITGIMQTFTHNALNQLFVQMPTKPVIIAIGQCAITGSPFGKGGMIEAPEIPFAAQLLGCPPSHAEIIACIRALGIRENV